MFKFNVSLKIAVCIINVMRVVDCTPMIRQRELRKLASVAILVALSGYLLHDSLLSSLSLSILVESSAFSSSYRYFGDSLQRKFGD